MKNKWAENYKTLSKVLNKIGLDRSQHIEVNKLIRKFFLENQQYVDYRISK